MIKIGRLVNIGLNLASIAVLAVLIVLLVKRFLPSAQPANRLAIGGTLRLPASSFTKKEERDLSLILFLKVGCPWCETNAPFYRALSEADSDNRVHLIAMFPQPVVESKIFLASNGIAIFDVRQGDIAGLGVTGTPTLAVVDSSGKIRSLWVGALSAERQADLLTALKLPAPPVPLLQPDRIPTATIPVVPHLTDKTGQPTIVDISPRDSFESLHISDSVNIPLDELEVRAVHELLKDEPLVVYCRYKTHCQTTLADNTDSVCAAEEHAQTGYCDLGLRIMHSAGFRETRLVTDPLTTLESRGVLLAGNNLRSENHRY